MYPQPQSMIDLTLRKDPVTYPLRFPGVPQVENHSTTPTLRGNMNSNSILEDLFSSEIMKWRYFKALSLSFLLQLVVSTLVCSTINTICFEVTWNPMMWIYYFFNGIIKPYWLLRIILPACCYIVITRIHVQSYSVSWWVPERRLQYFSQFFQPKKLLYSLALTFVSSCLLQYYAFLVHADFSVLTIPCINSERTCINHQALLIVLFGLVFGCRFSWKYFLHNYKTIQFPVTDTSLLISLKSKLKMRTVVESCSLFDIGLGFIVSVYVAYLFLGGMISHWISPFVGVSPSNESYPIWSIFSMLLDVRFFLTLILCLALLAYNLHCFFLTFQEIIVRKIELPLCGDDSPISASENHTRITWTLNIGLVSSCDLLKLLAFRHLRDIALDQTVWGRCYRAHIFAISQPGGHPRNWQSIVNPSLNLIRKFCDRLKQHNCLEEKFSSQQPTSHLLHHRTDINRNQLTKESPFSLKQKWQQAKESLKQFPFFCYLLSELPDSKNRQIFAEGQAVIWAVEGLSNLVATSYSDDQFGVVQKNIADILATLIQLQLVVEKVGRGLPYRRITQGTNFGSKIQKYPHDLQLRRSLRLTLRSSLYIITNTFRESIREIHVNEDVRNKLESYLTFQEG